MLRSLKVPSAQTVSLEDHVGKLCFHVILYFCELRISWYTVIITKDSKVNVTSERQNKVTNNSNYFLRKHSVQVIVIRIFCVLRSFMLNTKNMKEY